jgi:hypothetical protein
VTTGKVMAAMQKGHRSERWRGEDSRKKVKNLHYLKRTSGPRSLHAIMNKGYAAVRTRRRGQEEDQQDSGEVEGRNALNAAQLDPRSFAQCEGCGFFLLPRPAHVIFVDNARHRDVD